MLANGQRRTFNNQIYIVKILSEVGTLYPRYLINKIMFLLVPNMNLCFDNIAILVNYRIKPLIFWRLLFGWFRKTIGFLSFEYSLFYKSANGGTNLVGDRSEFATALLIAAAQSYIDNKKG